MKRSILTSIAALAFSLNVFAQDPAGYEGYPILEASEILKPEILQGPYHKVLESVPTEGFSNQYTIDTRWGVFTVFGNPLLLKRIHEFSAIAKLEEVSKSDEFKDALVGAAAKPVRMVRGTLADPVGSVKNVTAGAGRFLKKVGETVDRRGKSSANAGSMVDNLIGFSKAKRQIAYELNVDPYSDNAVLQQRLDDVARASFAGGFVVKAGMMAIPGGAGLAVGAVNTSADLTAMVRDHDPTDLSALNRKQLVQLGVSEAGANDFVEHPHITPTQQTEITDQLKRLGKVEGAEDFVKMTLATSSAADAEFFVRTVSMMVVYHEKVAPVKRVLNLHGLPAILAADESLVIPVSVDYGSWSAEADQLSEAIRNYQADVQFSRRLIYVPGIISPCARKELEARGFVVYDRASPAVYR